MAGTKIGGLKAAAANKERHGADFYAKIGSKGGRNGTTGGFYGDKERAKLVGAKGGAASRRGPAGFRVISKTPFFVELATGEVYVNSFPGMRRLSAFERVRYKIKRETVDAIMEKFAE